MRISGQRFHINAIPLLCFIFLSNAVTDCSSNNEIVNEYFQVIRIIDGDTFCIDDGSEKGCKVRLAGIDAPESRKSYKKNVQYYGPESTLQLAKLSLGKFVRLEYDIEKYDRYGRTLAYVFLKDGTFINAQLIKEGYAVVMTIPPNVKYADQFVRLQKNARKKAKGLWRKPVQ